MATWTTLPDASLEPGKPIRSIDGLALRDNPVAITEGAVGAPKIQTAALITGEQMTTANVLNATAGASVGAVGTYDFLRYVIPASATVNPGDTIAGSSLNYAGEFGTGASIGGSASGTWRLMGYMQNTSTDNTISRSSVFLRIS